MILSTQTDGNRLLEKHWNDLLLWSQCILHNTIHVLLCVVNNNVFYNEIVWFDWRIMDLCVMLLVPYMKHPLPLVIQNNSLSQHTWTDVALYIIFKIHVWSLTLHDNTCLWLDWMVGWLDVTLITSDWWGLEATGRDDCRGHCHIQSQVRPEGSVCVLNVFMCVWQAFPSLALVARKRLL